MQLTRYKLGQLLDASRGASLAGEYYAEQGKLIRLTLGNFDLANGGFKPNISKSDIYFTGPVREEFILNKGDIITPLTEQTLGLLGSTARIPESGKYIQSQDVALIKCKKNLLDPSFAYYLISSKQVRNQLSAAAQQTKIRHTTPDKLKDCVVDIPSIEEQRKIGKLLDSISEKIALNRQTNCDLEAMAKQLYDYWFVQFDFPNEEGKPYKSSGGKMVWNETLKREIPEGWEDCILSDIESCIVTGKTPSTQNEANFGDDVPFITIDDIRGNTFVFKTERYLSNQGADSQNNKYLEPGSLCCSCIGTVGVIGFVGKRSQTNQQINSIKFHHKRNKEYLYFSLNIYFQHAKAKTGNTFPNMSKGDFSLIPLLKPTVNIVENFHNTTNVLFEKISNNLQEINNLMGQRDILLPLLMNGQVSIKQ